MAEDIDAQLAAMEETMRSPTTPTAEKIKLCRKSISLLNKIMVGKR